MNRFLLSKLIFNIVTLLFLFLLGTSFAFAEKEDQPKKEAIVKEHSSAFIGATYTADEKTSHSYEKITTVPPFERYDSAQRWQGVSASAVISELKKFKTIQGSPALRRIWQDVLLSDFSNITFKQPSEQIDLMAMRLQILNRLGFFDEAVRLYQQAAMLKPIPEKIAIEAIEAMALSGSVDGACLETMMAGRYLAGTRWEQDSELCKGYFDGKRTGRVIKASLSPLTRAVLLATGSTLSGTALRQADPMFLASIAANKHISLESRLSAASRAADAGTIGFDRLRKLYETKHTSDQAVASIMQEVEADETISQSDLYAAARFTFEGNARAKIVDQAITQLSPATHVKSHVYGWIVDKLTLQPDRIKWFAPRGYVLMMATNRADSAKIYYKEGSLSHTTLEIIEVLERGQPWSETDQTTWKKAMEQRFGKTKGTTKATHLLNALYAYDTEGKIGIRLTAKNNNDSTIKLNFLRESIQSGGRGLTLLTGLNRLGSVPRMAQLSTEETNEIMTFFAKEGLFGPRKKIMLEILLQTVL